MSDWKSRATPVSTGDWKSRAISEKEDEFSVYTTPTASKIAEAGKWALGRVGEASQFIDKYTMGPVRAAIGAVQEGRSLTEPYDYEKTPTWKDIAEKAGMSGEPSIQSPVVLNPFDPEANKLSPAGIAGAALGTITDPLTYLGTPGVGTGVKIASEGAEQMLKSGARKAGEFAEERAVKAATGQNKALLDKLSGITRKGGVNPEAEAAKRRSAGRLLLDTKTVGPISTAENIGEKTSELYKRVQSEGFDSIKQVVDDAVPEGAVDFGSVAEKIESYANNLKGTRKNLKIKEALLEEAEILRSQGRVSFKDAQEWKNEYPFSITDPDPVMSNKKASNIIKEAISEQMENGVDLASSKLKEMGIDDGADLLSKYKSTKQAYGPLKTLTQAASSRGVSNLSNRMVSPSDYGAGLTGMLMGGMVGGDVNSIILGSGLGLANKLARERGPALAARSADAIKNMMQSGGEALSKYKPVLEKAAMAGNQSLIITHQTLMNNDPTYRQAVIQGLTLEREE